MGIKKYFWGLNPGALKETETIIKNPDHPKFIERIYVLLSRCDSPKELFTLISRQQFVEIWPRIRHYWQRKRQAADFRAWWETVYEQLSGKSKPLGKSPESFARIGKMLKDRRIELGLSQSDLARQTGMKQPDISAIELGNKNITLETLARLGKILRIRNFPLF